MSPAASPLEALLRQVLDVYRQPLRHRRLWDEPRQPLPEGVGELLDLALAPPAVLASYAARLRAGQGELAAAIRFFIHQALLAEGNDAYRMLGLAPTATPAQVKAHYLKLMRLYHPDRSTDDEWSGICAPRINHAYALLRGRAVAGHTVAPSRQETPAAWPLPKRRILDTLPRWTAGPPNQPAGLKRWLDGYGQCGWAAGVLAVVAGAGLLAWTLSTDPVPLEPPPLPVKPKTAPPPASAALAPMLTDAPAVLSQTPPMGWQARPPPEPPPRLLVRHGKATPRAAAAWPPPSARADLPVEPKPFAVAEEELNSQVLDRLAAAYRRGDLAGLMALFSESAITNEQSDREGIRREYARFFANTSRRELRLGKFRWQIDEHAAIGKGTFSLKVSTIEPNAQPSYEGTLILDVGLESETPLIQGFFQSYRELP